LKRMKRILVCVLAVVLTVPAVASLKGSALALEEIKAVSAVLMEANSRQVLFEKNANEQRSAASITKVMTLLLVMEEIDSGRISLEDRVVASEHAARMGGSQIWLEPGEEMTVEELLKATVIASANDAATALAEYVSGGSEESFVRMMNERAARLGMKDTHFINANGLDGAGQYTSAHDVALMSAELMKHEKIKDYSLVWMDSLRGGKTELVNTNKLIKTYQGITGLKTGTTSLAGSCLTATAERDGLRFVAVILGGETSNDRFNGARKLLDAGFAGYEMATPALPAEPIAPLPVAKGMDAAVAVECEPPSAVIVPKGKSGEIECEVQVSENLEAPIEKGEKVGEILYTLEGKPLCSVEVKAAAEVKKISFSLAFVYLLRCLSVL